MGALGKLPRKSPEELGLSSLAVSAFLHELQTKELELHSFMLLRHGAVAAEGWWAPYEHDLPHMLFSLSKSFTSTAVGLAISEGFMTLDSKVVSFFPEETPADASEYLRSMTVHHLLTMGTGQEDDPLTRIDADDNWVRLFMRTPVIHEPGTVFLYNSGATYILSAILQKVTGQKLLDYLQPRIMEPLGISGAMWESCPKGIHCGGFGLNLKTEDIAKFGQLYLQKGLWNGQRLIPEEWVEKASSKQISNDNGEKDWGCGYGYQFWRCKPVGVYRGDGAFGQYCIVMPEQDAVLAVTSAVGDMQILLDVVWTHLLPAFSPGRLEPNEQETEVLREKLQSLRLFPPCTEDYSPLEKDLLSVSYSFVANPFQIGALSLSFEDEAVACRISQGEAATEFRFGRGKWLEGTTSLIRKFPEKTMSACTWETPDTLLLVIRLIETPFYYSIKCRFGDEPFSIDVKVNVAFGPTDWVNIPVQAAGETG
ncbi:serine hydrolase domain-containing protein [Gorillibacterium massiliense]|uniref:serine hydrolase domain-containing protein n=1 Tax=Gorillibacterium massiliense TaxID=1280390 RepID=UPI0004ADBE51|nr:serine hydrolase [Gorillibacterium massiliense]